MCRDEDWWDNDGALNTVSMTHPRLPIEHPSRFVENDSDCQPLEPGIWLVSFLLTAFTNISDRVPFRIYIFQSSLTYWLHNHIKDFSFLNFV